MNIIGKSVGTFLALDLPTPPQAPLDPVTATRPFWRTESEHPRKVLVADDESLSAASVILSLKGLGYNAVGPARDGEHAVDLALLTMPDMALVDARMATDADGLDAARTLFRDLLIPVVIISAYADRTQIAAAAEAGVFGYLVKPVTKDQLGPAIEIAWARFNQYMSKEIEAEVLRRHLEDRQHIDYAKWALVEREGFDESSAMRELHRRAKAAGKALADIARQVLGR
ncbi:MAG: ANTAR domain-containing response regulator [Phycisphaerales bacterium]